MEGKKVTRVAERACGARVHWTHLRRECSKGSEGSEGGSGFAAGCVEGLHRFRSGRAAPAALRVADCPMGNAYKVSVTDSPFCIIRHEKHYVDQPPPVAFHRVEIIHPSHTTVRTVRYTAVRFFGQEYIPACHFFRLLKIILSPPFRIFASSAIFRQEVSPITAFCFNV